MNESIDFEIPPKFAHFETVRIIGRGSSAIVVLAKNTKNNTFNACKMIPRSFLTDKGAMQHIECELRIVEQLSHPGICRIEDLIYLPDLIILVMEFCPNCTLHDMVASSGKLTVSEANNYLMLILTTLIYLHSKNIAHRDLKLENIVLSAQFEPKLIDFGLSYKPIQNQPETCDSYCGTLEYIAPEVLNGGVYDGKKYDVWSLGICYYIMLTGSFPWQSRNDQQLAQEISKCSIHFSPLVPGESRALLHSMLSPDPTERATATELMELCREMFKQVPQFNSRNPEPNTTISRTTSQTLKHVNLFINRNKRHQLSKYNTYRY